MSRFIKTKMVEQYTARFQDVTTLAVISTRGVDVHDMTGFRNVLRERGLDAMVVKNRLCAVAMKEVGLEGAADLLDGPCTLVWGGDSIVAIAKALVEEARAIRPLEIKGGYADGQVLRPADIDALSKMPSREELLGQVVGRAMGQAARVAALAIGPAAMLVSQVREHEKNAPEGEGAAEDKTEAKDDEAKDEAKDDEAPAQEKTPEDEAKTEVKDDEAPAQEKTPEDEAKDEAPEGEKEGGA